MSCPLPAIILVRPQLGWNIGAAARAMGNFGLEDLRLVAPRGRHPSTATLSMASGAEEIVRRARIYPDLESAIGDLSLVFATSARRRDMIKSEITPDIVAQRLHEGEAIEARGGIMFGPERTGLENDEVVLAEALVRVPTNPACSSLNLAHCVLLLAYEYFRCRHETREKNDRFDKDDPPASKADLVGFFRQLESALEGSRFLRSEQMRPVTVRKIRNFFSGARPSVRQLRMLRGIVSSLTSLQPRNRSNQRLHDLKEH